jgi:hypothetical protein
MANNDMKTTLCAMLIDNKYRKVVRLRQAAAAIAIRALQSGNKAKAIKYLALYTNAERISGVSPITNVIEELTKKIVT